MTKPATKTTIGPYQVFIIFLCVLVLVMLAMDVLGVIGPEARDIFFYADTGICAIFMFDFFRSLALAPSKKRYMLTWGWIDLLSSIPALPFLRFGRVARLARLLRLVRGAKASLLLGRFFLERRGESAFLTAVTLAILMTLFSSIAILHFENGPEGNIKSAADAIWWSIVTMATVGYGDHYPVTAEGRLLAVGLMLIGIGVLGTFTAYLSSWVLKQRE